MKKRYIAFFFSIILVGGVVWHLLSAKNYFAQFPVILSPFSGLPYIDVEIEGQLYKLGIDSGGSAFLNLRNEVLKNINKKFLGKNKWIDLRGNQYESKKYLIEEFKIKKSVFGNVEVIEEDDNFITKGASFGRPSIRTDEECIKEMDGRIGWNFLKQINWFFDFNNRVFYASSSLGNLKKDGYDINKMIRAPLHISRVGITLKAQTDLGEQIFMLDTGATANVIRSSLTRDKACQKNVQGLEMFKLNQLVINGKDFGPQNFCHFEFADFWKEIDGIIGMDFFKTHVFYLDFKNNLIYIGKNSEVFIKKR